MLFTVEQAEVHDIEGVLQLDSEVLGSTSRSEYLAKRIRERKVWVARHETFVAGFTVLDSWFFGHPFIELLIVHPDVRRRGIGSLLMRKMESVCPTDKLFTSTNESNTAMQRLCESLGFVKTGYIENLDEGDPEIVYFKRLRKGTGD